MRTRTLGIQLSAPDLDESAALRVETIYDPRTAADLTARLSEQDREQLALLLTPCLWNEEKNGH